MQQAHGGVPGRELPGRAAAPGVSAAGGAGAGLPAGPQKTRGVRSKPGAPSAGRGKGCSNNVGTQMQRATPTPSPAPAPPPPPPPPPRYAGFELGQRGQLQEIFDELKDPKAKRSSGGGPGRCGAAVPFLGGTPLGGRGSWPLAARAGLGRGWDTERGRGAPPPPRAPPALQVPRTW
jgi:hypothetical protein